MGNILSLQRNGLHDNNTYDVIDDLSYTYNGNQVIKIDDDAVDPVYNGCFNFKDGADEDAEYEYDGNGNLTMDLNRDICSIEYNCLNLPERVDFGDDSFILYTYNAKGEKLKTAYFINQMTPAVPQVGGGTGGGNPQTTFTLVSYCDGLIFENNALKQIPIEGGYVTFNGTTPQYHFYIQDHQGNNRVVCNSSGTIEQVNHYYPYGGLFGESTNDEVQRYKYNGKELDRMQGLNLYDYGARQYDAALGQFTTMDPLCEKYYNVSPYAYCAGNPVMYVDPDGRDWYQNNTTQYYTWFNCEEELKGFTHIGEKGSLLGEFESKINNILTDIYNNKDGLYSEGHAIDITNPDKGCILPSDYKRMNNFLDEFVFGYGPEISILTDNHPYTKELKTDDKVIEGQQLLRSGKTEIAGQLTEVKRQWGVLDVLSTPSLAKQYVGSYSFDSYTAKDGKHLLNVIYDTKNARSLFYHIPGTGYLNHARNSIIKPLSTTYQFYIWKSKK